MQAGSFVASDVSALTSLVHVNGIAREHQEWSISREISGDLPDQVVAGSGIRQATGTIVWAEQPEVTDRAPNPWNASAGWLPKAGDLVVIYVGDGARTWIQFAGVIDETSGDVGGSPQSTIIDYTDWLNRPFSHSAVLRLHPPHTEGADFMGVGLSPAYVVDRLFRAATFYATPALEPGAVMSAPLQTSAWPERGKIVAAGSASGGASTHGSNERAPWGWCMRNFAATYQPQSSMQRSDPLQMTAMASPDHAGSFTMDANFGTQRVRLSITAGRTAVASLDGVEACRLALGAGTVVSLLVKGSTWTLKTDAGGTASGSMARPAGDALSTVTISGDQASRIAGLQVAKPTTLSEFQSIGYRPTAYQETSSLLGIMDAMPSVAGRTVREVLDEISKATLSPYWFSETGRPVMYGSDVLRGRAPVQEVTTLDDITKLSWLDARLGVRSSVAVKYRYPALNRSKFSNVLLWQGSGETMTSGQEKTLFATEPADEDWVEADDFTVANAGGLTAFNQGRGSWVNTFLEDSSGNWSQSTGYVTWSPQQIVDTETRLFKVVAGNLPAGRSLVLATPEDAVNYSPRMRGMNMPVLRGRGKVQWADMTLTSSITGPSGFPALEHDAGCWGVQADETFIQQRIADYIASQVSTPQPTITGMGVTYDPRRQLGDVITIKSPALMGVELRALIVGVQNQGGDSFTQSLDVRIISAKSTFTTYEQFNAAGGQITHDQWQLLEPKLTHAQFNSQPAEAI